MSPLLSVWFWGRRRRNRRQGERLLNPIKIKNKDEEDYYRWIFLGGFEPPFVPIFATTPSLIYVI